MPASAPAVGQKLKGVRFGSMPHFFATSFRGSTYHQNPCCVGRQLRSTWRMSMIWSGPNKTGARCRSEDETMRQLDCSLIAALKFSRSYRIALKSAAPGPGAGRDPRRQCGEGQPGDRCHDSETARAPNSRRLIRRPTYQGWRRRRGCR